MKKILVLLFVLLTFVCREAYSKESKEVQTTVKTPLIEDIRLQNHIDEVGFKILNANKIDVRMVFVYDKETSILNIEPTLRKRQIIAYDKFIKTASSEAELAAFLSREICKGHRTILRWMISSICPQTVMSLVALRAAEKIRVSLLSPLPLKR